MFFFTVLALGYRCVVIVNILGGYSTISTGVTISMNTTWIMFLVSSSTLSRTSSLENASMKNI